MTAVSLIPVPFVYNYKQENIPAYQIHRILVRFQPKPSLKFRILRSMPMKKPIFPFQVSIKSKKYGIFRTVINKGSWIQTEPHKM